MFARLDIWMSVALSLHNHSTHSDETVVMFLLQRTSVLFPVIVINTFLDILEYFWYQNLRSARLDIYIYNCETIYFSCLLFETSF